jgi:AraC family transcriptional regulator
MIYLNFSLHYYWYNSYLFLIKKLSKIGIFMKRDTLQRHIEIANGLLNYIYTHIDTDINLDELAIFFKTNKYHLHKIFKSIFEVNIYESIKSIRLQKASNLLLTNQHSTISEIANLCGYSSQTSFIRAFKKRFSMTPKAWRVGGYKEYSKHLIEQISYVDATNCHFEQIRPTIVKMPSIKAYYIRHRGYEETIKQTWQKIQVWLFSNDIKEYELISLFHDNPALTPLKECHHVASVLIKDNKKIKNSQLPQFTISSGVYAKFDVEGKRGDLLQFIQWVYHEWLPKSGYETTTNPPYAIYRKNHHLSEDKRFDMSFYLSVRI